MRMTPHDEPFCRSAEERCRQINVTTRLFAAAAAATQESVVFENGWLLRPLLEEEIATLQGPCRCSCRDWTKLRLLLRNDNATNNQSLLLKQLVRDNTFEGVVVLGIDENDGADSTIAKKSLWMPAGVFQNALISNSVLEPNCRVQRNMCLRDTHVCRNALVSNCGQVSARPGRVSGGTQITVGPESGGGRKLTVTVESTMIDVCESLMSGFGMPDRKEFACDYNIIGPNAILRDTSTIENVHLASNASIQAATSVKNAVLLPHARIENSSTASHVLLQWNACIRDASHVSDTLLMEQAHAGPHSHCATSVLGPDVHISAGEVHASVLGPNTNAHHQSLVISVLWPLGRGNVGYGANVGSNHTGRLPDQETCTGEGTFWGLSTVIKFPVNLLEAPYSIVAAGTTLLPQRVCMPFSLLVDGQDGGGLSQILPGWVLLNSPYTLTRSELKFANRRKAQRHFYYTGYKIIRPDVIDMCIAARDALKKVSTKETSVYKTDKDVAGIGKNYLTQQGRQAGIQAYTACVQRYALWGLLEWLQKNGRGQNVVEALQETTMVPLPTRDALKTASWPTLPWKQGSSIWYHQWSVLQHEFPASSNMTAAWVVRLLGELVQLEKDWAQRVYQSKKRDDVRGAKTIPGYAEAHVATEKDAVIMHVQEQARKVEESVAAIVFEFSTMETRSRL